MTTTTSPESAGGGARYPFHVYPNGWFRVALSEEVGAGELKTVHYFGRELVVFRGEDGIARVIDAHCPHLGAHIGHGGVVVGEGVRCPFHHWEFDGRGACTRVPYAKKIPPKARLRTYPVAERSGAILVWHERDAGPEAQPRFEVPDCEEIGDPAWTRPEVMHWIVRASWLDMNENCVDQAHFKYVHGTLSIPPTTATIDGHIHVAESIFRMAVPGGEADATLVTLDHGPGFQLVRISGLIDTLMVNTATPIDEDHTDVVFTYTVKSEGDTSKEHLAQAIIKDLKQQFEHDRPIWENKIYQRRPVLCDGDGPIATYRKWYKQFA